MYFFHGESKEWRLLAPRGKLMPTALCRHTSLIFGSKLYIFGGTNLEETFNDLWVLDLGIFSSFTFSFFWFFIYVFFKDHMQWNFEVVEGPYVIRPRCNHTMTKISDSQFAIIGGSCGSDYFADIHLFDISTFHFICLVLMKYWIIMIPIFRYKKVGKN